jgi:hypothetical protein
MECPRCWRWDSHSLLCYFSAYRALERPQKRAEGVDSGSLVDPPSDPRIDAGLAGGYSASEQHPGQRLAHRRKTAGRPRVSKRLQRERRTEAQRQRRKRASLATALTS